MKTRFMTKYKVMIDFYGIKGKAALTVLNKVWTLEIITAKILMDMILVCSFLPILPV